jgi:peroxiredoxin
MKIAVTILIGTVSLGVLDLSGAGQYSNRRAPGFSLMDSHFEQHDPQDYRGKVLLVEFMQTTCAECNTLADALVQVKTKYGDRIGILSVVTLPDNFQTAEKFTAAHKVNWPILFDSGQVMMSWLKLRPGTNMDVHFPHVFLVDGTGTIRNDFEGTDDKSLTSAAISAEIDKLLK